MQVTKILPQDKSSKYPEIKKQLCDCKLWSYGEHIGIVGIGTTYDVVRKYIENQVNQKKKKRINK